MATDRRERAKSIRAARDWLTGAEHALAGEDDLAGDLKLMLARAELARIAADRRARLRRFARWLLPPLAGVAVLAYVFWGVPPAEEVVAQPPAQIVEQDVSAPAAEAVSPMAAQPPAPLPAAETQAASEEREHQEPQPAAPVVTAQRAEQSTAPAQLPRMPDADMQRLMQVGGKILRE